jgi:hypothetical protein
VLTFVPRGSLGRSDEGDDTLSRRKPLGAVQIGDHLLDPHSGHGFDVFGVEHRPGTVRVVDGDGLTHIFAENDIVDVIELSF